MLLQDGKTEYKSTTVADDATAEEFMDFYLDDSFRHTWVKGLLTHTIYRLSFCRLRQLCLGGLSQIHNTEQQHYLDSHLLSTFILSKLHLLFCGMCTCSRCIFSLQHAFLVSVLANAKICQAECAGYYDL